MGGSIKIDRVTVEAGCNYNLVIDGTSYPFSGEAGGVVMTATV